MAKNVFIAQKDTSERPPRNTFDLSFQNNLTLNFGTLYPVMCRELVPGSSISIKPTFALQALPTYFPIQTRVRANLHFYSVRLRNLWDRYVDWYGGTLDSDAFYNQPPYIDPSSDSQKSRMFRTGSLADYLGVPTALFGNYGSEVSFDAHLHENRNLRLMTGSAQGTTLQSLSEYLDTVTYPYTFNFDNVPSSNYAKFYGIVSDFKLSDWSLIPDRLFFHVIGSNHIADNQIFLTFGTRASGSDYDINLAGKSNRNKLLTLHKLDDTLYYVELPSDTLTFLRNVTANTTVRFAFISKSDGLFSSSNILATNTKLYHGYSTVGFSVSESNVVDAVDYGLCPFVTSGFGSPVQPISALPFRAYESIYNAFYRNEQNDPFEVNGNIERNKYLPYIQGGYDDFEYQLHSRSWEPDMFTSAVQSPQQGIAPLVGITSLGEMKFQDPEDPDKIYSAKMEVDADGKMQRILVADPNLPKANLRALVDAVSSGISINDFRNVNALQRWLEKQVRRGYKFRDQIMSHFGIEPSFDELDMPEFIGGFSLPVIPNKVSATSDSPDVPLGDFAGQMSCIGTSEHNISYFADEPCYIMAILSISPVPVYPQRLDKMFTRFDTFDNYFSEFAHIGYQPVLTKEIAPLQVHAAGDNLNEVFGYQRPWYDYISAVDEVHGQMRNSLRDYLINRVFDEKPVLNSDFVYIHGEHLNDVFNWKDSSTDKFMGQVYFDIQAKLPIPRVSVGRLE